MRTLKSKIKSPKQLAKLIKNKKKIVFTNGCFDILHKGHVTYLQEAKKLGNLLIVGLNTDSSVQKIKGPTRPIQNLEARAAVIAALESVDYVTWFSESTPVEILKLLRPQIYVKGADWKGKGIPEEALIKTWKGKVSYLKFIDGFSSTSIIEKSKISR